MGKECRQTLLYAQYVKCGFTIKRYSDVRGNLSLVVDGFRSNRCDGRSPISHWSLIQCS